MKTIVGSAYARIGLLGNPSDGYGGRVLAMTYQHRAWVGAAGTATVEPLPLRDAAIEAWQGCTGRPYQGPPLAWGTLIPRQAGLSGSSALIIATLRALGAAAEVPLEGLDLARLAWRVETEHLGIAAGPQDRVVQALEGVLDMDFGPDPWRIERLAPGVLPPLLLGWPRSPGEPSGTAHAVLGGRHDRDEPGIRAALGALTALVGQARERARARDPDWRDLFDRNLALRQALMPIAPPDLEAAQVARSLGAGAKLAGSGGALVATAPDADTLSRLAERWHQLGRQTLVPQVSTAAAP